jgi:signal transduction histidine kinase
LTEEVDADFTSPFLAIFALTVLSATLRWDWRAAAQTGSLVTLVFVTAGLALIALHLQIDVYRYARRALYMVALLMMLVWFGLERSEPRVPGLALPAGERDDEALLWQALDYARALTRAEHGLIGWTAAEEPWTQLRAFGPEGRRSGRTSPEEPPAGGDLRQVRLFDCARRVQLLIGRENRPRAERLCSPLPLADWGGIGAGLALPFFGVSGSGIIVLGGIDGPGHDFLVLGKAIAREIGTAFDRVAIGRLERDAVATRTRSAVARDLHDSVAQSLAGACFRLEALRAGLKRAASDGVAAEPATAEQDIITVRDALRREQSHVRALIETLRSPASLVDRRDLRTDIDSSLGDAGAHWGLAVALDASGPIGVPGWLSHEIQQLVREAVANAARHGSASRVTVRIRQDDGQIAIDIADDGRGFDMARQGDQPWSISERVAALGGSLSVGSGANGTRLAIILPQVAIRNSTP